MILGFPPALHIALRTTRSSFSTARGPCCQGQTPRRCSLTASSADSFKTTAMPANRSDAERGFPRAKHLLVASPRSLASWRPCSPCWPRGPLANRRWTRQRPANGPPVTDLLRPRRAATPQRCRLLEYSPTPAGALTTCQDGHFCFTMFHTHLRIWIHKLKMRGRRGHGAYT